MHTASLIFASTILLFVMGNVIGSIAKSDNKDTPTAFIGCTTICLLLPFATSIVSLLVLVFKLNQ